MTTQAIQAGGFEKLGDRGHGVSEGDPNVLDQRDGGFLTNMAHHGYRHEDRKYNWERVGTGFRQGVTAAEAFATLGSYNVRLEPIKLADGTPIQNHRAIIAERKGDGGTGAAARRFQLGGDRRLFSIVSDRYELVTPQQIVQTWDKSTGMKVEGIAPLYGGRTLMFVTQLPSIDVDGDEVENHLILLSPMTGEGAIKGILSPVRQYCTNQFRLALRLATESIRIPHTKEAGARMTRWLTDIDKRFNARANLFRDVYAHLAKTPVSTRQAITILQEVYPNPRGRQRNGQVDPLEYQQMLSQTVEFRLGAAHLFDGAGTGMEVRACAGTAWGLLQAVVEAEDRRPGNRQSESSVAISAMLGSRAETKARAMSVLAAYADIDLSRLSVIHQN